MEKSRLLSRLSEIDAHIKQPLVELTGCRRVLVENHSGVMAYSQEEITLRMRYGYLRVVGQNMILAEMRREQLVISGQIDGVFIHRG